MGYSIFRFLRRATLFLALLMASVLSHGTAARAQSLSHVGQVISVDVVPGWRDADGTYVAGLKFRLLPGWRTYWRSAGSAGIAPRLDWSGSENVASVQPVWPRPQVFRRGRVKALGYDRDFVLPLRITPSVGGDPVVLVGRLELGVCAEICLPAELFVRGELPATGQPQAELQAALADQPVPVAIEVSCHLSRTENGAILTGALTLPPLGGTEAVVFEVPDEAMWVTDAVVTRDGNSLTARSELMVAEGRAFEFDSGAIRITVIGRWRAVEVTGCSD